MELSFKLTLRDVQWLLLGILAGLVAAPFINNLGAAIVIAAGAFAVAILATFFRWISINRPNAS